MSPAVIQRIGIAELEARLGIERSTVWRWYRAGRFPPPEYIGTRRTWRLDVVEAWERARLAQPPPVRRVGERDGATSADAAG